MKILSRLLAFCVGNPPVTGGFPTQRAGNVDPWYSVFTVVWIGFWTNNQEAGELKRPKYYVPSLLCIQEQNSSISEWLPKCSKEVHLWFLSQSGEYMKLNILSRFCRGGIRMIFWKICWGGITKTFHEVDPSKFWYVYNNKIIRFFLSKYSQKLAKFNMEILMICGCFSYMAAWT